MKHVHDVIQSLAQSLADLQDQFDILRKLQQQFDHQINDIYHELETATFNARDGYKYAKKLQDILRQRRIVKTQLRSAQMVVNTIKPRDLIGQVSRMATTSQQMLESTYDYLGMEVEGDQP